MRFSFFSVFLYFLFFFLLSACAQIPGLSENSQEKSVRRHVELGMAYLEKGNRVRAKEKLLYALKVDPKSSLAQRAMAYYWECVGEIALAEKSYKRSIRRKEGEAYNDYGAFLCRQHRYEEADSAFEAALKDTHYAKTASTLENRAVCAQEAGNTKKAQSYFEQLKRYQ